MRSSNALGLAAAALALWLLPAPSRAEPQIGPAVGNADLLVAEGTRLYNEKAYALARDRFLKATRVSPSTVPTYLSLARSYFALKDLERACHVYKVYVKNAPEGPEREKAQGELDLCERQLAATGATPQLAQSYVSLKASFFEALDRNSLVGPASASEVLRSVLGAGYAAPDLGELAKKLATAAETAAEGTFQATRSHQKLSPDDLRRAADLYGLALDFGATPAKQSARASFLQGMALVLEGKAALAVPLFEDSARRDASDTEARFYRGLAKYLSGDKGGAIKALDADLPNDPRTGILRMALALEVPGAAAAAELEKFLFARKFKSAP